jgi:UDP-N-acetylglucosamine 2-epimerase (hydrolysing)
VKRVLFLLGTRPEAIKMAPVILRARQEEGHIAPIVVSTGQHRQMLDPVLAFFGIRPDRDLGLMRPSQTLEDLTARAIVAVADAIRTATPDAVVVQGDTTTAMAGALAAFYANVPVAHVEAGLRTNNLRSPFPEEMNRRVIGQVASIHFAPTRAAAENLRAERLEATGARVLCVGNTVIDALLHARDRVDAHPPTLDIIREVRAHRLGGTGRGRVVLVTGHRRENFGPAFEEFCLGLRDIAEAFPDVLMVYPVHLNPNVQEPVQRLLGGVRNIRLCAPAEYPAFVALMTMADLAITDSGGVQEEAPALGVPVLVTRTTTERPEAVAAGGVMLVGPDRRRIAHEATRLLRDREALAAMARPRFPYGDGHAARRIVDALLDRPVREFR